ncbi:MAG TPA: peptidoglycan-binding protein [Devosia sp.]|jgi:peptidoglycan hydrolase-like protein with peptidoglycan-binding domain|uniref:peptidoglycan-binding protein n=1 Tax=Devosia sp. TaxID=1871048 RepID=UPI002DDCC893|nr:peptidoglycan-binding protein [Devosia sp.]HEV2517681.1 peptidoglycan-binding protein [Devosia sp.]
MRNAFRLLLWLLLLWASTAAAYASFDDSKLWFERLSDDERSATQTDLILLGHYPYLVDGQFGRGTFDAIAAFQKSQGRATTGVLTDFERRSLRDLAGQVDTRLGIELVSDNPAHVAMMIPLRLLSIRNPTDTGTSYVSEDGEFSLETMHVSLADQSFEALFDVMTSPDPERTVTYRSFGAGRFVVSGQIGDYSFYTMFVSASTEAVGYSLAWGQDYAHEGAVSSVYIASHFTPLGNLRPPDELKKAEGTGGAPPRGAFSLPEDQLDLIVLNADITDQTPVEFDRALAARPNVRIVALNSPGGSVDSALRMADEIHKRGLTTFVPPDMGCYSACAYIFFAGVDRQAVGELGVHQISSEIADLVLAQTTLGDVLDAMQSFGVDQRVISHMLRTPPDDMYVFSQAELAEFGILSGDPVTITVALEQSADPATAGGAAIVHLSSQSSATEAERSRAYIEGRWSTLFGEARPEVESTGDIFRVQLPTPSLERANAICAAIKADGGGCYVTGAGG